MHARVVCGHMLPRQICKNGAICCVCVVWLDQILSQNNSKNCFIYIYNQGRMQDFPGGRPTIKFCGFWITMPGSAYREQRSCEPLLGAWGHAPHPRKLFKMVQFRTF